MNRLPIAIALLAAGTAHAVSLPKFDLTCPDDIDVRAEGDGPVYIGDKQAVLSKFSEQYYEAKGEGVTLSISLKPDGSPTVTYTGKQGTKGLCEKKEEGPEQQPATKPAPVPEAEPQG